MAYRYKGTRRKCNKCGVEYTPNQNNSLYCGSKKLKKGCAHKVDLERRKALTEKIKAQKQADIDFIRGRRI